MTLTDLDLAALIREVPDYPTPGIVFKDLTPLLADADALREVIDRIVGGHPLGTVDKVVGIEARGFLLAAPVAYLLRAGLVLVRKPGKLPRAVHERSYDLEYGTNTLSVHQDAVRAGERVLIVDDVLATGGTAAAAVHLVEQCGAVAVGLDVLLELTFLQGRSALPGLPVRAVLTT
ncbi:MAG TPA: adenine phosphoribosyltransferase [Mycobacteriales bacterium]|nr:adenine phosphoribosyltransferase [Mycobacteriales bacterium]